jgi:hypothetical protein
MGHLSLSSTCLMGYSNEAYEKGKPVARRGRKTTGLFKRGSWVAE